MAAEYEIIARTIRLRDRCPLRSCGGVGVESRAIWRFERFGARWSLGPTSVGARERVRAVVGPSRSLSSSSSLSCLLTLGFVSLDADISVSLFVARRFVPRLLFVRARAILAIFQSASDRETMVSVLYYNAMMRDIFTHGTSHRDM